MENDRQTIKKCFDFHYNSKSVSKNKTQNYEYNAEIDMESMNNRTNTQSSQVSLSNSKGIINPNSSKIGSRRIFTPHFKLQVLESYRNDSDCKGNQRATARKYNIHRRQIQKWLQCESSLRSSVANINTNSVKHQFHNVSLQQQTKNAPANSHSSISVLSHTSNQQHSTQLCVDSSREAVLSSAIKVPSLTTSVSTSSAQGKHDVFESSNLPAVVAASETLATKSSNASSTVSPLRPLTIVSANVNRNSSISPLLHHHYGISYNNIYQQHVHPQTQSPHQTSYQYHNMAYSSTLSHHHIDKHQSTSYFTPISLPAVNISGVSTINNYPGGEEELAEKLDLIATESKTYNKFISEKNLFLCNNKFHSNYATYECPESSTSINTPNINIPFNINQFKEDSTNFTRYSLSPIDLSIRHRRDEKSELATNVQYNFKNAETVPSEILLRREWNDKINVVDLTHRKRRITSFSKSSANISGLSEKHTKLSNTEELSDKLSFDSCKTSINNMTINACNDEDDIEIEVGIEEKFSPSCKPVKLFKPYLLDECEKNENDASNTNKFCKNADKSEQLEHVSDSSEENARGNKIFLDIVKENNTCIANPNFQVEYNTESPRRACSPVASIPTMSPKTFQYPKGSPASSGYESSTSTYSDSSTSSKNEPYTYGETYSLKLQMQTIYNESTHVIHPSKHVQRWLEKDDSKPLSHNSSIALLV